jgi:hypothetical protein
MTNLSKWRRSFSQGPIPNHHKVPFMADWVTNINVGLGSIFGLTPFMTCIGVGNEGLRMVEEMSFDALPSSLIDLNVSLK